MKLRLIKFGPKELDQRSFGVDFHKNVQVLYVKLYLFGIYFAYGAHDPAAELERMITEKNAAAWLNKNTNRHQRRSMEAMMRKQHHVEAH